MDTTTSNSERGNVTPNGSLCHFIEHVEGEHRELLPMSAGEAVVPLRRLVLRRLLAPPTRYRALACRDGERWRPLLAELRRDRIAGAARALGQAWCGRGRGGPMTCAAT
jgi:hypothetical protein